MNKKLLILSSLVLLLNGAFAQEKSSFYYWKYNSEMAFVGMDSIHDSQSTVIEYPNFLVLVELPFIDAGGGKSINLKEDVPKAEAFLQFLKEKYPNKPVKYVLSSHWHLHSLSGISPFFKAGAQLVAAKSNWEYSKREGLLGDSNQQAFDKNVIQVQGDTVLLAKSKYPIQVLFLDSSYSHKPTRDYLFFYFPQSKILHASCMGAIYQADLQSSQKHLYSDRLIDAQTAISTKKIDMQQLVVLSADWDPAEHAYEPPVFTQAYFQQFIGAGRPFSEAINQYSQKSLQELQEKKSALLTELMAEHIPAGLVNSLVYRCIAGKEYEKAVLWAELLNLYQIGNPNFVDTMGEAYYFAGYTALAERCNAWLFQHDKNFEAGLKSWEANKKQTKH